MQKTAKLKILRFSEPHFHEVNLAERTSACYKSDLVRHRQLNPHKYSKSHYYPSDVC